ncbi:insulinase family protein [Vibrio orientalis]|nr:insulinase family protein [Vibrio orientalis]
MSNQYRQILSTLFACTALVSSTVFASSNPSLWYPSTDIHMPKSTTVDRLDNGLRYVVLPTTRSSDEVSIRVRVNAGVAQENNQFPTARIVALDTIQNTDWHVSTDYQQTVFDIDFASATNTDIEKALEALYVGLTQEVKQPNADQLLESAQGSLNDIDELISQRHLDTLTHALAPLDDQSLSQTPLESVKEFKQTYFTPNQVSIVVVGGIKKKSAIKAIERQFSSWRTVAQEQSVHSTPQLELISDVAQTSPVTISSLSTVNDEEDSKLHRKELLMTTLANKMLEQRIQKALSEQHLQAQVDVDNQVLFDHRLLSQVRVVNLEETDKTEVKKVVKSEIKRALASGFTQTEYEMVVSQVRQQLERQTRLNDPDNYTRNQADRVVAAIDSGSVYTAPSYDLDLLNFHVAHLNEFDISKEFEHIWSDTTSVIM